MALHLGLLRFSIGNPVARDTRDRRITRHTTTTKALDKDGSRATPRTLVARL